ncbi:hypothetical protein [Engelhardtia mirabilis]|uniref:Glycerophosphoryl diester phosphodiesterase membrane domain-containing protein n=1 Tax=Engelhardtia mirabilis TaxID=2528011 RepID=A0A518BNN5_9BACT|nr:hypothetical protein Pla133_36870 [Planctomycetes bacterium Pla133]QDV02913.1 hypothetical protein Pla86_36850 [Planctomycetes bacterium Pla86]
MSSLLRPMSVGEVLDGSFALYRRHFLRVVTIPALIYTVVFGLGVLMPMLGILAGIVVQPLIQGALVWSASELILDREPALRPALKVGLVRLIPLLLVTMFHSMIVTTGFFLLIVPGLIAATYFFPFQQVVVLEKRMNFLDRGVKLVRGGFKKCLGVIVISYVIAMLPTSIMVVGVVALDQQVMGLSQDSPLTFGWMQAAQYGVSSLVFPFTILVTTLLYYERRVSAEGLDVERSAAALERSVASAT